MQVKVVVFLFFLQSFVCFSQSDSIVALPEVLIENKASVNNPLSENQTVHIANYEYIKENSLKNVAEATNLLPGIYLQDYGGVGGLKTVSSRGLASSYTRVFINGVEFHNSQNGQVDLGKIPISNVSKISFVNGVSGQKLLTASSYNSPQSVYIETVTPEKNSVKTSLSVGSFGLVTPTLLVSRRIGSRHFLTVGGEFTQANGEYDYQFVNGNEIKKQRRVHAGINRSVVNLNYQLALTDSQTVSVNGYWNTTAQELPGAVILYQQQTGQNLNTNDLFLTASYKDIVSQEWQWKWVSSATLQGLTYLDTVYNNQQGFLESKYQNNAFFTSLSSHYQISKYLSLNSAIDFRYASLSKSIYVYRNQLFMSNELKYKYNSLTTDVYALIQTLSDEEAPTRKLFNYGFSTAWLPFEKSPVQLHGSYSKNYRVPTFQELYFQRVFVDLVPEKSQAAYVGVSSFHHLKKRELQISSTLDFFINRIENKIVSLPTQNLFVWSTRNLGEVQIKGIETNVQLSWQADSNWTIDGLVSYTYQQAWDVSNHESRQYQNQLAYTPYEIIKANCSIHYKKWLINWGLIYNGFRYSLGENIEANLLSSWQVHNLSLAKEMALGKLTFDLQLSVKNIFNNHYAIIKNFPMPGRNYIITLALEI